MTTPASQNFTAARTTLFVVGSGVQLDTVRRVVPHLKRPAAVLDLWSLGIRSVEEVKLPGHLPPVTLSRMRSVGEVAKGWARATDGGVLVTPQDVGLVYRRVIAAARHGGASIVLLGY
ncbi:MAG: hypothetical protein ACRDTD_31650 [Pseudonocardiaceae bacterium]